MCVIFDFQTSAFSCGCGNLDPDEILKFCQIIKIELNQVVKELFIDREDFCSSNNLDILPLNVF